MFYLFYRVIYKKINIFCYARIYIQNMKIQIEL